MDRGRLGETLSNEPTNSLILGAFRKSNGSCSARILVDRMAAQACG